MTSVSLLIDIFKMDDISKITRANLIVKIGDVINWEHGTNLTEGVVAELVQILVPDHKILNKKSKKQLLKDK